MFIHLPFNVASLVPLFRHTHIYLHSQLRGQRQLRRLRPTFVLLSLLAFTYFISTCLRNFLFRQKLYFLTTSCTFSYAMPFHTSLLLYLAQNLRMKFYKLEQGLLFVPKCTPLPRITSSPRLRSSATAKRPAAERRPPC